jgi:nuclear transport factor 2 (NTF2) superfamily protein
LIGICDYSNPVFALFPIAEVGHRNWRIRPTAGGWRSVLATVACPPPNCFGVIVCPSGKDQRMNESRPPFPPYDLQSALEKVQAAEDAWNTCDPHRVSLAYTIDSAWRNRNVFITGREKIVEFLTAKWQRELDYALRKSLWDFHGNRIAVRFQDECRDASGQWWRSYGNELWEFDDNGLMRRREASINDLAIDESERRYFGPRPDHERVRGHDFPLR